MGQTAVALRSLIKEFKFLNYEFKNFKNLIKKFKYIIYNAFLLV